MPLYKGPAGFGRILNIVVNFIISVFFVSLILGMAQSQAPMAPIFTPLNFIVAFIPGLAVAYLIGDLFPFANWGNKAYEKIGSKVAATLVRALIMNFCFTTSISLVLCWVNNVQSVGLVGSLMAWWTVYPIGLVGVFFLVLIAVPLGTYIAKTVSGFDPSNPSGMNNNH